MSDLLRDLLTGRQATIAALTYRSRRLGFPLAPRLTVLTLRASSGRPVTAPAVAALLHDAAMTGNPSLLLDVREDGAVVLCSSLPSTTPGLVSSAAWVGCAVDGLRPVQVRTGYALTVLALERAPAHAHLDRPVLDEVDAQLLAVLAGDPLADPGRLAILVSDLFEDAHRPLLDELDAFLATGSATGAAERLGLHAQSLRHRLRRLQEAAGRDVRRPSDRCDFESARRASSP